MCSSSTKLDRCRWPMPWRLPLSAMNLVLLGDPQQLDQPLQGVHPPGAERSALAHVLYGERVMPDHLGLFLDGSWRLHPEISAYTSEVFYEGRLHSHPGRERLDLEGAPPLSGTGIRFVPVLHSGQSSESPEEAEQLATLVRFLFDADPTLHRRRGLNPLTRRLRRARHHAVQRAGEGHTSRAPRLPRRHRRQVPRARGAHRHLLDGDKLRCRGSPRHGVSLQPQPPQCGHEPGAVPCRRGREPRARRCPLPHPPADAARERPCTARGGSHWAGLAWNITGGCAATRGVRYATNGLRTATSTTAQTASAVILPPRTQACRRAARLAMALTPASDQPSCRYTHRDRIPHRRSADGVPGRHSYRWRRDPLVEAGSPRPRGTAKPHAAHRYS